MISTGARAASELLKKAANFAEAVRVMTDGKVSYTSTADTITFSNGSRVLSLPSGNPAALRGYSAQVVVIDEAAFIDDADEVYGSIAPTLTRDPDAELVIASTPAGRNGFFYEKWSTADDSWYVQETTIEDAVADGLEIDLEDLHKLVPDPDVFAQEYMCQFLSEFGSMLDVSLLEFYGDEEEPRDEEVVGRFLGVDVGRKKDRSAIVSVKQVGEVSMVSEIDMLDRIGYQEQLDILKAKNGKWRYSAGYVDATGIGSMMAEFTEKSVSPLIRGFVFSQQSKLRIYELFRSLVYQRLVRFHVRYKEMLEREVANVQRIVTDSGTVKYVAGRDESGHSDAVSGIALALCAAHENPVCDAVVHAAPRSQVFGASHHFQGCGHQFGV